MLIMTLVQIVSYLISIIVFLVIVQFIISLLFAFNVLSPSNDIAGGIYRAVNMLLDPLLRPIRKILPDTGMMDFSPLVLIVGLNILRIVLTNAAISVAY